MSGPLNMPLRSPRGRSDALCGVLLLVAVAVVAGLAAASSARAQASAFDEARERFRAGDHEEAARRFERIVESTDARGEDALLHWESRKYLGITYLYLRREPEARAQVRAYLEYVLPRIPGYRLDPVVFAQDVVEFFDSVKAQVEAEQRAVEEADAARREAAERARDSALNAYVAALEAQASELRVERERSRWIAALPFGVGQFQNGHEGLGWTLLLSESALAVTSVVTFALAQRLPDVDPRRQTLDDGSLVEPEDFDRAARAYELTNWISTGLLAVLVVVGVVDAQLRFQPVEGRVERRPLPPDPRARLDWRPGGIALRF